MATSPRGHGSAGPTRYRRHTRLAYPGAVPDRRAREPPTLTARDPSPHHHQHLPRPYLLGIPAPDLDHLRLLGKPRRAVEDLVERLHDLDEADALPGAGPGSHPPEPRRG